MQSCFKLRCYNDVQLCTLENSNYTIIILGTKVASTDKGVMTLENSKRIILVPIPEPTTPPASPFRKSLPVPPATTANPVPPGGTKTPGNPVQAILCDSPLRCRRSFIPDSPKLRGKSASFTQASNSVKTLSTGDENFNCSDNC